jgi:hypothetical protein
MAAFIGVVSTFGLTTPAGGYTQESEQEETRETVTVRDETGTTVVALPKLKREFTVSIKGKGDPAIASVTAGAFSADTVKVISAKGSESSEEFPDFEITGKKYSTAS